MAFNGKRRFSSPADYVRWALMRLEREAEREKDAEIRDSIRNEAIVACPNSEPGRRPFFRATVISGEPPETRWRAIERYTFDATADLPTLHALGLDRFRRLLLFGIDLGRCICAWVEDYPNWKRLSESPLAEKYPRHKLPGDRANPGIVHPITWLRRDLVDLLGGWERMLVTPAHQVRPVADGLMIELVDGWFDDANEEHRAIQVAAMEHLGFPWR